MSPLRAAALAGTLFLTAACGAVGGDEGDAALSEAPSPTTREAPSIGPGTTVPAQATTTVARARPTTTARGAAPTTAALRPAAPAPRRVAPAAPGTYRYDTAGQTSYPGFGGATSPYPAVTTLMVDPPVGDRQHATRDLRDAARNGPVIESMFDYRADGVYLESLRVTATVFVFTNTQEFRPSAPTLLIPTGVEPGYSKDVPLPATANPARLVVDVLREERVTIGGQGVDTIVARLTATLSGQVEARMELTVWLAPTAGVWVKERSITSAAGANGQVLYQGQYEATLQRLLS